uniref:Uncharacterized protein n=1 Tax=Junco hyemalis TaxID=40217 RepID=A0A8C5I8U4_JUNHY
MESPVCREIHLPFPVDRWEPRPLRQGPRRPRTSRCEPEQGLSTGQSGAQGMGYHSWGAAESPGSCHSSLVRHSNQLRQRIGDSLSGCSAPRGCGWDAHGHLRTSRAGSAHPISSKGPFTLSAQQAHPRPQDGDESPPSLPPLLLVDTALHGGWHGHSPLPAHSTV